MPPTYSILLLGAALVAAVPAFAQKPSHRTYSARFVVNVDARRLPIEVQSVGVGCELRHEGRLLASGAGSVPVNKGSTRGASVALVLEVLDPSFERLLLAKGGRYTCAIRGVRTPAGELPLGGFPSDPKRPAEASGVIPSSAWPFPEAVTVALALRPPPGAKGEKAD